MRRLALLPLLMIAAPAAADVISPDQAACHGKTLGQPCTAAGVPGHCAQTTCGRLDYSQGTPPRAVRVPCVICRALEPTPEPAPPPGPQGSPGDPQPFPATPEAGEGAPPGAPASAPHSEASRTAAPTRAGCSTGEGPAPLPWVAGLLLALGLWHTRQRR
jgi:MYXO-CTERM domain-containing protein